MLTFAIFICHMLVYLNFGFCMRLTVNKQLITIACTLSVTNAKCEQSISHLLHLMTYLRGTMTEEHLKGLAMLYFIMTFPVALRFFCKRPPKTSTAEEITFQIALDSLSESMKINERER